MSIGRKFKKGRRPPKGGATEAGGGVVVEVGVGVAVDDVSVEVGVGVAVDSASPSPLRRSPRHQPSPLRRSPRRQPSTKVTIKSLTLSNKRKDNKIKKTREKNAALLKENKSRSRGTKKLKQQARSAEHAIYHEKKASRANIKDIKEQNTREQNEIIERYENEVARLNAQVSEAHELVREAENKAAKSEEARINAEAELKQQLRDERCRHAEALKRMKEKMTELLTTELTKSLKDQIGMQAIIDHNIAVAQTSMENILAAAEKEAKVMHANAMEQSNKLRQASKDRRKAVASMEAAKSSKKRRTEQLTVERESRTDAEDRATEMGKKMAAMESEIAATDSLITHAKKRKLRKVRVNADNGKRGGGMVYPQWVMTAICELLTCGASPSSIGDILKVMYRILYNTEPTDIPCINYIRRGRMVLAVFNETMSAMKLAIAESWDQLCTDATTRRQIPFTALIIGLLGDDSIEQVIVSSCILTDDESAVTQAEAIIDKVRLSTSFLSLYYHSAALLTLYCSSLNR